jgi:FkbM family methyltransferase
MVKLNFLKYRDAFENWPIFILDKLHLLHGKQSAITRSGLKISFRGDTDRIVLYEVFANHEYDFYPIKNGEIIIDIGAHIGAFTCLAASKGANVYSFEPVEDNYILLEENLKQNSLVSHTVKKAIFSYTGDLHLNINKENSGGHSIFETGSKNQEISVQTTTLSDFMKQEKIEHIDLLKIDCEGSEYEILPTLPLEKIDKIMMEFHYFGGKNPLDLISLLEKNNFEITKTDHMIYAKNKRNAKNIEVK